MIGITILPPVNLGGAPPKKQNIGSKALDQLSSLLLEPKTVFTEGLGAAGRKVRARREKIRKGDKSEAFDVIGETLTATALAGGAIIAASNPAAAAIAARALIPKTIAGKVTALTGLGILTTSEKARDVAGDFLEDPTKLGREAGLLIDKAAEGKDVGSVTDALKAAGLVGAGVAAAVGTKKIIDKFRDKPADTAINTPSDVRPSIALPASSIPDALAPISDAPVVATTPKETAPQTMPDINVKVINKPQVNVAVAQSI